MGVGRPRLRDSGLGIGSGGPGPGNAITDVPGVRVGHTTLISGEGPLRPGRGPVRTGVTVVLPHGGDLFRQKVRRDCSPCVSAIVMCSPALTDSGVYCLGWLLLLDKAHQSFYNLPLETYDTLSSMRK